MTWEEMHIGLDLGLQFQNSNLFDKLQPEAKDYFLNRVVKDMVKATVDQDRQNVSNLESYNDIRAYSSLIEPLIRMLQLDKYTGDGTYDYGVIPKDITPITSGKLYAGREYRVTIPGTTNLTSFGGGNPSTAGSIFTCIITTANATSLTVGCKYRILTTGTSTFTTVGAANNMIGTEFIATGTSAGGTGTVTPLSGAPTWAGGTELALTSSESMHELICSYSNVDYGQQFSNGSLTKGVRYKVVTGGTITGLTAFGSGYDVVEAGYIFLCTASGIPTWSTSGVVLIPTKTVLNRLVKVQDVHNFLQHAYGTVTSSPISVIANGKLMVYHDAKFAINEITAVYVCPPATIDSVNDVDCDLNESFHGKIIDDTVKFIMAYTNHPSYQAVVNENTKKDS